MDFYANQYTGSAAAAYVTDRLGTDRHDLEVAHTARAQTREDTAGARGEATVLREEVTRLRAEQAAVSDTVK